MREPGQHGRMLDQQGEIGAPPADRLEQPEETLEHGLGARVLAPLDRGHLEEPGNEVVDALLRQGRQRNVAVAGAQPSEVGDETCRVVEARLSERIASNSASASPRQTAASAGRSGARDGSALSLPVVVLLPALSAARGVVAEGGVKLRANCLPMGGERRLEIGGLRVTAGLRERGELGAVVRDSLRLPIVAILQPVLDVAEEHVGGAQHPHGRLGQKTARGDRIEGRLRAARAKRRLAAAANELQRLHDEFDFADAAGAELDVERVIAALAPARGSGDGCRAGPRRRRNRGICETRTA